MSMQQISAILGINRKKKVYDNVYFELNIYIFMFPPFLEREREREMHLFKTYI